ncbi:hypothetical protein [Actibacterium pelagium]|uniref:Uncharacterized protein n=1 Tax=Actibacterium pelagium TaxID=2029103 RepID=A0A917ABE4_9RHOB|nr:hypothetical protein [Actibacterium pelagium]GGE40101.1 hypothetical protein GCM10011517_04760 [Actibacterium pelagium]
MLRRKSTRLFMAAALFVTAVTSPALVTAETKVGSSVESRVILAFKANDAAVQAMMPEGWKAITLPKGPIAGTNLLVVFMDRHLMRDAEGKPLSPSNELSSAVLAYGVKKGVEGARMFVAKDYGSPPLAAPYGKGTAATLSKSGSDMVNTEGDVSVSVSFSVAPETGGEIGFDLSYTAGTPSLSEDQTAMPHSTEDPEFHRIYRYDQLVELLMSKALGKPLNGTVTYTVTAPELAAAFDGSEELVSILAIPVYVRDVFLP